MKTIIARKGGLNVAQPVTQDLVQSVAPVEQPPVQPVVVTPDTGSSGALIAGVVLGAGGIAVVNAYLKRNGKV